MAPSSSNPALIQGQPTPRDTGHVCFIVPPHLLQGIIDSGDADANARLAAQRTLSPSRGYREARDSPAARFGGSGHSSAGRHSIIPPHVLQAILDSDTSSPEDKDRAQRTLARSAAVREAREGGKASPEEIAGAKHLYRVIYDSHETNHLPGTRVRREGQGPVQDENTNNVYDAFEKTFEFYNEVFGRNSIDDNGMNIVGSVHFDDVPGPPGYDNAFWDDRIQQMIFGDGDQTYFASFTKDLDVIAHELTHGVTSRTGILPYHDQSGALNESVSDVFGSMVKQYSLNQTVDEADWLIGAHVFTPSVQGSALRSMKEPGKAYDDPIIGSDPQPATMNDFKVLSNDRDGDSGGVHINSGIPNHAFYLVATQLGGHSWDKAGKIWYATLTSAELKSAALADKVDFKLFADLTCKHAAEFSDSNVLNAVKKAWTKVGIYPNNGQDGSDKLK